MPEALGKVHPQEILSVTPPQPSATHKTTNKEQLMRKPQATRGKCWEQSTPALASHVQGSRMMLPGQRAAEALRTATTAEVTKNALGRFAVA